MVTIAELVAKLIALESPDTIVCVRCGVLNVEPLALENIKLSKVIQPDDKQYPALVLG